jgi:Ca-activated chloride channel family protein
MVVAVARPAVTVAVPSNQTTIILAMDVSGSMCSGDIAPNRLVAAEAAAASFIDAQASDSRIGIVAFSGFAEMVQAPTSDRALLQQALQSLVTGRRTAIGSGILASIDAINSVDPSVPASITGSRPGTEPTPPAPGSYVPDIIVLLTDGANNAGPLPSEAAQQAANRGVRVFTIGFGTANGGSFNGECARQFIGNEPGGGFGGFGGGGGGGGGGGFRRGIDENTLKEVAALTGGTYHPAESADQLKEVFAGLPTNLVFRTEAAEVSVVFVGLGLLAAAAASLFGRLWRPLP